MTGEGVGPLSRPMAVARIPAGGLDAEVEATDEERRALAADLGLTALRSLTARLHLDRSARRIRVTGRVRAEITQTCVVTLEPFESILDEEVAVEFVEAPGRREPEEVEVETDLDAPDPIVDGRIDLGAVAAEFLALGLDPHPRKPGVAFAFEEEGGPSGSPFGILASRPRTPE